MGRLGLSSRSRVSWMTARVTVGRGSSSASSSSNQADSPSSVSYTNLTLPTNREEWMSGVSVQHKKTYNNRKRRRCTVR